MEKLLKLVKTYRLTQSLAERLALADEIFAVVEPQLRLFVFGSLPRQLAEDTLQEALKSLAGSLGRFQGNSVGEFWAFCYSTARHRIADCLRKTSTDRLQPLPEEELWHLVDASAAVTPLSADNKIDLAYAMGLLKAAKSECYHHLWNYYVFGLDYAELAKEANLSYDAIRVKIRRCLDLARELVA